MLQIYNNLTKTKEPFQPIDPANVRMYVCGMTVYDLCHLGHARALIVFDMVNRYLREIYGPEHVTYVRNITDIDDKIIQRAQENHEAFTALTQRFIAEMDRDADALGVLKPDEEPKATHHMAEIIAMIAALVERGYAYVVADGDVYYQVSRFSRYGQLSGKRLEDLRAGARVAVDDAKSDPLDFVLWKSAKPGEPSWDSPWGRGRPGWHIECSAMSTHCLGNHFDIHGGGLDLQFPHHENEIAQSEAATGESFVNVWMHNGHVRINEEKMSKSLGNFFTVREILARIPAEAVRYFVLNSHYRSPLNYSDEQLDSAKAALDGFYTALRALPRDVHEVEESTQYAERFMAAMDDDFNTPEAIAVLAELRHAINRARAEDDTMRAAALAQTMRRLGAVLGLLQSEPETYLQGGVEDLDNETINRLVEQRNAARAARDWATADRIRDELESQGIVLEDGASGTSWRRK